MSSSVFAAVSDAPPAAVTDSPAAGGGAAAGPVPVSQYQTR